MTTTFHAAAVSSPPETRYQGRGVAALESAPFSRSTSPAASVVGAFPPGSGGMTTCRRSESRSQAERHERRSCLPSAAIFSKLTGPAPQPVGIDDGPFDPFRRGAGIAPRMMRALKLVVRRLPAAMIACLAAGAS